jgi:fermentation-respiration switch protein FrsA (DUF1100 family)
VLLDVAAELQPPPDCVAVSGAFLSARAAAVRLGALPVWAQWLLPDALDSLENAGRFRAPMLIEHGSDDEMFPPAWAAKLGAAHAGAQVTIVPHMHHGDPMMHPGDPSWGPVIAFVNPRAAPSDPSAR